MRRTSVLAAFPILAFALMHLEVHTPLNGDEPQGWKTIERQFLTLPMESRRYTGPLFWLHGDESPEVLTEYLQKVAEGGQGCFTAESRPHNDWLGEGWYRDLDICLQAAKRLDLKMWIFDERWWPSGEVGGKVPQQYGSKYVQVAVHDVRGPGEFEVTDVPENLVAVIAGPQQDGGVDGDRLVDLTERVKEGALQWNVPEGSWKVMVFHWQYSTGRNGRLLVDGASQDAVDWYIRTVYQPHFDHLGAEFGKQIVGYFYDEPETLGDWGTEVLPMLEQRGIDWKKTLVAWKLKLANEDQQIAAKYQYQDALAEAWGKTFYGGLTKWCHEHNVQSIGHFLEHAHDYLSPRYCGGNMVQLQKYSDMGAIDAVFRQFVPGHKDDSTYQSPKLGSSISHAYGKKDDRAMVEIFGARGQDLSYPEMKWWTDVMHVAGINFHIPHSFNPRSPYDRDCPPYFYNHGFEPRWPLFRVYADYTSRLTHLLTGGHHVCPVALLYLGNSHHVGKSITPEDMTTALQDALFDCDWIPYDVLENDMQVEERQLCLRKEHYSVLIIPAVEVIPYATLVKIKQFYDAGGVVVGYGMLPSKSATLGKTSDDIRLLVAAVWGEPEKTGLQLCRRNDLGGRSYFLPAKPTSQDIQQVLINDAGVHPTLEVLQGATDDWLHVLHRVKEGRDLFLVCNEQHEGVAKTFRLRVHAQGIPECWDAMRNEIRTIEFDHVTHSAVDLSLTLQPLESVVLVFAPRVTARPPRLTHGRNPARTPLKVKRLPNAVRQTKVPVVKTKEDQRLDMNGCFWVWYPGDGNAMNAPPGTRCFRHELAIPVGRRVTEAKIRLTADNSYTLFVNGNQAESGGSFQILNVADLKKELRAGPNVLAVVASNGADYPNPAGLVGRYYIELDNGDRIAGCIDTSWKCADKESPGWKQAGFDDGAWVAAGNVAPYGAAPWGKIDGLKMLTLSPVKADPFFGQFTIPDDWRSGSLRILLETKTITPENAAAVRINGQFVGGFIGKPNRLDITDSVKTGMNQLTIAPFAPGDARIVAYSVQSQEKRSSTRSQELKNAARLSVRLDLNRDVYSKTRYKHPPQFAVWIESPETGEFRTLYVTQKLGRGTWNGKPTVPVSLPYWVSRHNKRAATKGDPTREHPLADAITQPTPTSQFNVAAMLPLGTQWQCFVEVNVSGDFNDAFPASHTDGTKDRYGNGQPSLVYRAAVEAESGNKTSFKLLGRTSQWKPSPEIQNDLEGITTAKKLFKTMQITVDAR